jgi:hypothetical protein
MAFSNPPLVIGFADDGDYAHPDPHKIPLGQSVPVLVGHVCYVVFDRPDIFKGGQHMHGRQYTWTPMLVEETDVHFAIGPYTSAHRVPKAQNMHTIKIGSEMENDPKGTPKKGKAKPRKAKYKPKRKK